MEAKPSQPPAEELVTSHHSAAEELIVMAQVDQEMRSRAQLDMSKWDSIVDERNTARLEAIVAEIGWPTISKVGAEASHAAWLLAQHSNPECMKRCLALMKQAPEGDVRLVDIAYLEDRVRIMEDKPQIYGTQFCKAEDRWQLLPVEDPEHLDERRASVGIGPIAEYIEIIKQTYGP